MSDNTVSIGFSNVYCCVPQCKGYARKNPNLHFHRFPRVKEKSSKIEKDRILQVREEWVRVLKVKKAASSMVVCSSHFKPSDYFPTDNVKKKYLKKYVVPSMNLPLSAERSRKRILNSKQSKTEGDASTPNVVYIKKLPQKSGRWCAVAGCKNKKGNTDNVSFFSFPKDPDLKKEWIQKCGRAKTFNYANKDCTICSAHFKKEDFQVDAKPGPRNSKARRLLRKRSIPSRNLPKNSLPHASSGIKQCETIAMQKEKEHESDSSSLFQSSSDESQSFSSVTSPKKCKTPFKCCVPWCRSSYKSSKEESVGLFKFPLSEPARSLWLKGIGRESFEPSKFSVVCEKHFKPSEVIKEQAGGSRLRKGAAPSLKREARPSATASRFSVLAAKRRKTSSSNNTQEVCAEYIATENPTIVKFVQCDESKNGVVDDSDETGDVEIMQRIDFIDLTELEQKLPQLGLYDFWTLAKGERSMAFVHIKLSNAAPKICISVVVDENLLVNVFHGEERIKSLETFSFPTRVRSISELKKILKGAKQKMFNETQSSNKVELVSRLLNSLKQNMKQSVPLSFMREQLSLLTSEPQLYSSELLIFATLLFSMAPHVYKFLTLSEYLILPELDIIKNLYIPLQTSPYTEITPIQFLKHAKESFHNLKNSDKQVVLQIEEIHLKPFLEVDGNIAGMSVELDDAATSVFVFMINSLSSNYKDTVHLLPVQSPRVNEIHNVLKEVIIGLESIGFQIIAVATDDSLINRQVMSLFSEPQLFNCISHKHPCDSTRPLFHLISYAYLLKRIRNDWMLQNNSDECFYYPAIGTDEQSTKTASFTSLKKLNDVESSSYLKCFKSFSSEAVFPSNTEKHNIEFVLQIFNYDVTDRLLFYGEDHNLPHYEETADFIKLICTWWSIVNPKSPLKETSDSDLSYKPLLMHEKSYAFLQKFSDWLDCWSKSSCDSGKLTARTYSSLHLSTNALLELTAYCKNELGIDFIFPGNFQTDHPFTKFGCCGEIHTQPFVHKKWPLSETLLKTLPSLTLTLAEANDVNLTRLHCEQAVNLTEPIEYVNTFIPLSITDEDMNSHEDDIPVLLYLAGHCVHSVSKELSCELCMSYISTDADMVLHPAFCENNEEPLKCPSKFVMDIVVLSFTVLSKLSKEHASEFWTRTNRNSLAYNLTMNILESIELGLDFRCCEKGHSSSKVVKMIVRSVVYYVLNNHKSWNQSNMVNISLNGSNAIVL